MPIQGPTKCICGGSNAQCNFCYGAGYVVAEPEIPTVWLDTITSRKFRRPLKAGRVKPLEILIKTRGAIGSKKKGNTFVNLLHSLNKIFKHDSENQRSNYNVVREKIYIALQLNKVKFIELENALLKAVGGSMADLQRANALVGPLSIEFSSDDITLLQRGYVKKATKQSRTSATTTENTVECPLSPEHNTLLVIVPAMGLSPEALEELR